ncbi:hypothetical protein A9762_19445 [Pandoraea sp. ISTKB]|nr:hypothetical protein A9762_19445 [Pandoraea sp. ISTKB]
MTQGEHVYLNFAKTQRMFADGTLLFVAELNRLYRYLGERPIIRCNYPRDKIVEQVLQQVGVFDMIGKPCRENVDDLDASVKFWKYATGTKAIGELFEPVLENYEGIIEKRLEQSMYKGVTEAMTNSSNHAYIDTRPDGLSLKGVEPRWWMFSQERDGSLIVALCDLGVGIPASLPKTRMKDWTSDSIRAFLTGIVTQGQISTDCVMIKAAIEIGRTRTDLPYRGRGLQQLKDVIDVAGSGHLTIHSNKGCYQYDPSKRSIEIINDYRDSVLGTLILWNVPITSVNQSETHDHH